MSLFSSLFSCFVRLKYPVNITIGLQPLDGGGMLTQEHFPYCIRDVELPQCNSGFVYMLMPPLFCHPPAEEALETQ